VVHILKDVNDLPDVILVRRLPPGPDVVLRLQGGSGAVLQEPHGRRRKSLRVPHPEQKGEDFLTVFGYLHSSLFKLDRFGAKF